MSSHSEGYLAKANGKNSHSEGQFTKANGEASHAEGFGTTADGKYSHTEGWGTSTTNYHEHAEGAYNKSNTGEEDSDKTIHSIGIGADKKACKNAVEVMANGDAYIIGIGGFDGTNYKEAKSVQEFIRELAMKVDKLSNGR